MKYIIHSYQPYSDQILGYKINLKKYSEPDKSINMFYIEIGPLSVSKRAFQIKGI